MDFAIDSNLGTELLFFRGEKRVFCGVENANSYFWGSQTDAFC